MINKNITLSKILDSYRCMSIDINDSWRKQLNKDRFSKVNLLECSKEEIERYTNSLSFTVSKFNNVKVASGTEGELINIKYILNDILNCKYNDTPKSQRPIIMSMSNGKRNIGKDSYLNWNGFQAIDLDIHDAGIANTLKSVIFEKLCNYNWFLGVTLSTSGDGLHVYTKIMIPEETNNDINKSKLLFLANYRHKFSFVYISLMNIMKEMNYDESNLLKWMDMAMFRPNQPLYITADKNMMLSTNFFEDFIYVSFDNVTDMGHPDVDWISYPPLREKFKRWEWFEEDSEREDIDIIDKGDVNINSSPVHYKHFERWKLANTLVNIFGERLGYEYLRKICSSNVSDSELRGDCQTASRHSKPIDNWAINILNKRHGFKIKVKTPQVNPEIEDLHKTVEDIYNPTKLSFTDNVVNLYINKSQYLSDIRDKILDNISRVTLIEAGAGVGKTEMVKSLAREGKRVMMIMPFTSTIKSKVENQEGWVYAYGNKKVNLQSTESLSLTIDKFSRLSLVEIAAAGFDYIFLDESHLMFQSEYRSVMPKVIDMIRFSEVPIIMMSGTPVGELIFFPDSKHIKVEKEDVRIKKFNVIVTDDEESVFLDICKRMASDISEGRRVIFPTNKGTLYKEQVRATVQYFIEEEFNSRYQTINPIIVNYYKKSNLGEKFMDDINIKKTIGKTDILLCSNYLSVGVDIEDKHEFSIYINDLWMPQEIEQFANRLRNNNLNIYLYVSEFDTNGDNKYLFKYNPIDLKLSVEEMKTCHSILQLCNAAIERNPVEYKYNSLISSIIHNNNFIEYNEVENKYYLNETSYKVVMFERKYREYVCQLPCIIKGMQDYGYEYTAQNRYKFTFSEKVSLDRITDVKKQARTNKQLENIQDVEDLLDNINDDNIYIFREALRGRYEIKKGSNWNCEVKNNIMMVKNIEIFEKVIPIVISFSKIYNINDIKSIFEHCKTQGRYNFSAIGRIKTLSNIIHNDRKNRLDIPIKDFMNKLYRFIEINQRCHKSKLEKFIDDYVLEYAQNESGTLIPIWKSKGAISSIKKGVERMVKCLADISRSDNRGFITITKAELLWSEKDKIEFNNSVEDLFIREFILGNLIEKCNGFDIITDNVDDLNYEIDNSIESFNNSLKFTELE